LESLRATGSAVTVIDVQASADDPRLAGVTFVRGDCRQADVLAKANVHAATGVVVVTSDDLVNVGTALLVRKMNPDTRIVVRMFNQNLIARLGSAVKNTVALSVSALTAPLLALLAVTGEALAAFPIGTCPQQIMDVEVRPNSPILGERLSDVAARFKLLILAHTPIGSNPRLLHETDGSSVIREGDRLAVCGAATAIEPLVSDGHGAAAVRWAGGLRRLGRTIHRTAAAVDAPVKVASVTLFVTLLASTLVFRFGAGKEWADSLYQTVSVVATGADLHGESESGPVKVFLSVLKLAGAALIAAFTAIFTNYLLKARLGGALEERRIPDGGHVVVCGLGNIGFRCVRELLKLGVKVVAVERSADCPFAATVRQMGAAVVIGDATVPEVLRQARADKARAVIAAIDLELANLEIALLVRELNQAQRVVVRITDPQFAQAVRSAADIRYAVSPPELAAPAFAAALLGDRVQSLVVVGGRTLAVVELVAQPGDELCDRSLHELMVDYRFLPLGVVGGEPFAETGVPRGHRVTADERVLAVIELADLQRMLRREPPPADWSVVVDEVPLSAGGELVPLIRTARGCSQEEAKELLGRKGFALVERVNRGKAEELLSRLTRERVSARIVAS
jgi:Trk K+ transport system NAD-binding subunit